MNDTEWLFFVAPYTKGKLLEGSGIWLVVEAKAKQSSDFETLKGVYDMLVSLLSKVHLLPPGPSPRLDLQGLLAPWSLISLSLKFLVGLMVGFELLILLIFVPGPNCVASLSSSCSVWLSDTLQSMGLEFHTLTSLPLARMWPHNRERTCQDAISIDLCQAMPSVMAGQRGYPMTFR